MFEGEWRVKYKNVAYDPVQDKFLNKDTYLKIVKDDPGHIIFKLNKKRTK